MEKILLAIDAVNLKMPVPRNSCEAESRNEKKKHQTKMI